MVDLKINKTPGKIKGELKARIVAAFTNLKDAAGKICRIFRSRQQAVVEAKGDFFGSIKFQDVL